MPASHPWPPPSRFSPSPGFNCGWCHQRVSDLGHVALCRLDGGESSRLDLQAFERERLSHVLDEIRGWVQEGAPVSERETEESTFVISLEHDLGQVLEVLLDLGSYAERKYTNVRIEFQE